MSWKENLIRLPVIRGSGVWSARILKLVSLSFASVEPPIVRSTPSTVKRSSSELSSIQEKRDTEPNPFLVSASTGDPLKPPYAHRTPRPSPQNRNRLHSALLRPQPAEAIGDLPAGMLLDFFLEDVAPAVYNKAVSDAQTRMQARIAEIDSELYEDPFQYWHRLEKKQKKSR